MKLLFFGRLRDEIGADELDCFPPPTVDDAKSLRLWIESEYPALLDPKVRMALDEVLVNGNAPIAGVSEVAFLPPVSGG